MVHWLFPANTKHYDVFAAFDKNETYWPVRGTVASGDSVFIYLAAPYKQIGFLCGVDETGLSSAVTLPYIRALFKKPIDAKKSPGAFMRLTRQVAFQITEDSPLCYDQLRLHGLNGMLMGPRKLENNPDLLGYIKVVCDEI